MGNALATSTISSVPVVIAPDLDRELSIAFNGVKDEFGNLTIAPDRALSADAKDRLSARSAKITQWLAPAGPVPLIDDLGMVFVTMAMRGGSPEDVKVVAKIYAKDLGDLPAWAVSQACRDFRQGKAGDGKWAPTQAEIRIRALDHMARWREEKTKIDKVLAAKPERPIESPERRKQVVAEIREAISSMRTAGRSADTRQALEDAEAKARADQLAEMIAKGTVDPEPLPQLSDAARGFPLPDRESSHA